MRSVPKVVYDGTIYTSQAAGGMSRYYTRLIEEAAAQEPGWEFEVHVVRQGTTAKLPQGDGITVHRRTYFTPALCCVPLNYGSRQYQIRKTKPSLLHTTLARPFCLRPCPLVTTIHDMIIERVPECYAGSQFDRARRWWRWSGRSADAVLTVSHTSRSDIVDLLGIDPARIYVTYPGVDEAFYPPTPEEIHEHRVRHGLNKPYVLYVGHRGEHKNFRFLAEVMMCSLVRDLDLVYVGGGPIVAADRRVVEKIERRSHHVSKATDSDLRALYGGAVALVFPSVYEGFGFPLVEAMSCGVPVVASDIPSSREVCHDAAEFFPLGNVVDCACAILRCADSARRRELLRKGSERAKTFNWKTCALRTLDVYRRLL